jgi:multidrug efflux system membrane fusion protein
MRRLSIPTHIGFLALVAFAPGCGSKASSAAPPPGGGAPTPVTIATVGRADVPVDIRAIGTVEPLASVVIKPQVAGLLVDVRFEEGADVRAGDLLLQIDPRPFQAALHVAEAELARDQAVAGDKKEAAEQIEGALQKSAVSQRSASQARADADAALAVVKKDEATVENARLQLEYGSIRAPFDGRTGKLEVKRGSVVKANETEMLSIHQIVPIRVAFAVPEKHLSDIRKASADAQLAVQAQVPGADPPVQGVLTFVDNSVDTTTGTIRLMATFANEDRRLWPGQFVQVSLRTGIDRDVVVVPARAVQTGQKGSFVFVVGSDRKVETRPVSVRRTAGDASVIAEGLSAGEIVVTDGQLRLVPGARVEPRESSGSGNP